MLKGMKKNYKRNEEGNRETNDDGLTGRVGQILCQQKTGVSTIFCLMVLN